MLLRLSFLAACLLSAVASAQSRAGNVAMVTGRSLLQVTPEAIVSTITGLPSGLTGLGVCTTTDNLGVAILTKTVTSTGVNVHVLEVRNGQLQTLVMLRGRANNAQFMIQGGITPEQRGDYVIASPLGLHRVDPRARTATRVDSLGYTGVCDDLGPGGWVTFSNTVAYRVSRAGVRTTVGSAVKPGPGPNPFPIGRGGVFTDTQSGDVYVCMNGLLRLDRRGVFTSLAGGPPFGFLKCGDVDPGRGTLILADQTAVYRTDRQGNLLATLAQVPGVVGVAVVGSLNLAGTGAVSPATTYALRVSFPALAASFYQLGASFGFFPGIPTPAGTVGLNPDSLLVLSLSTPAIFAGFAGQLNASGQAAAQLNVPNVSALKGVRFFLGGVAYRNTAIQAIAEPWGLTVE